MLFLTFLLKVAKVTEMLTDAKCFFRKPIPVISVLKSLKKIKRQVLSYFSYCGYFFKGIKSTKYLAIGSGDLTLKKRGEV